MASSKLNLTTTFLCSCNFRLQGNQTCEPTREQNSCNLIRWCGCHSYNWMLQKVWKTNKQQTTNKQKTNKQTNKQKTNSATSAEMLDDVVWEQELKQTKPWRRNGLGLELSLPVWVRMQYCCDTLCNMMARKMMSSTSTLERPAAAPSAKPSAKITTFLW